MKKKKTQPQIELFRFKIMLLTLEFIGLFAIMFITSFKFMLMAHAIIVFSIFYWASDLYKLLKRKKK
jgi:hypothetical protein